MPRRRSRLLVGLTLLTLTGAGIAAYVLITRTPPDIAAAEEALDRRDFKMAHEHLNRYLASHPTDTRANLLAAQAARRDGNWSSALAHLKKCDRTSQYRQAIELEERLLNFVPTDPTSARALLDEFSETQSVAAALVFETIATRILATTSPVISEGTALPEEVPLLEAGLRASELWLRFRHSPADQACGLAWRGQFRKLLADHEGAVTDLRASLELNPEDHECRLLLALTVAQSAPKETLEHLTILNRRRPEDPNVRFAMATGYRGLGRLGEASQLLDDLLLADPQNPVLLVERGQVAIDASDLKLAEQVLVKAVDIAPHLPEAHLALSRYLQLSGQHDRMKLHYDRFVQLEQARKQQNPGRPQ